VVGDIYGAQRIKYEDDEGRPAGAEKKNTRE
jgi:hypothetical protein